MYNNIVWVINVQTRLHCAALKGAPAEF